VVIKVCTGVLGCPSSTLFLEVVVDLVIVERWNVGVGVDFSLLVGAPLFVGLEGFEVFVDWLEHLGYGR